MRVTNKLFYPDNQAEANRLAEEYRYLGFHVTVDTENVVTVFAIPPRQPKPKREKRAARKSIDVEHRP